MTTGNASASEQLPLPRAGIVIVNWNGWEDLLECLESVLRLEYPSYQVILCDNGSTDGSPERIRQWAGGRLDVLPERRAMSDYVHPPVEKPISLEVVTRGEAERGSKRASSPASVVLIQNGANIGFAAGNNVGLRYGLAQGHRLLWLLNPDTVVAPNSLRALADRMRSDPGVGMCGSVLRYYDAPDVIEEAGGCAYYPLVGIARRLLKERTFDEDCNWREIENRLDYISGASCLLSQTFLEDVGLMSEDYFLYGEEIDWAYRCLGSYALALAPESIVYHKKGRSIGSKSWRSSRTPTSAYYLWRARARVTKRYHSTTLPVVIALGMLVAAGEFILGHHRTADAVVNGVLDREFKELG